MNLIHDTPSMAKSNQFGCCGMCVLIRFIGLFPMGVLTTILLLSGCEGKNAFGGGEDSRPLLTHMYNYTQSEILFAQYQDAAEKFDITKAAPAGTTLFTSNAVQDIGRGVIVHFDEGHCCFNWRLNPSRDVSLRVVWLEVYNSARYRREGKNFDERSVKTAVPGSQWCEMIVTVQKPYPADPGAMNLHFMPDGSVEANVAAGGVIDGYGPYPAERVLNLKPGKTTPLCKNHIANPWYLIPRKPYRE